MLASCPDLLSSLSRLQHKYLRKTLIDVVLATDMAVHSGVKDKLSYLKPQLSLLLSSPRHAGQSRSKLRVFGAW